MRFNYTFILLIIILNSTLLFGQRKIRNANIDQQCNAQIILDSSFNEVEDMSHLLKSSSFNAVDTFKNVYRVSRYSIHGEMNSKERKRINEKLNFRAGQTIKVGEGRNSLESIAALVCKASKLELSSITVFGDSLIPSAVTLVFDYKKNETHP